MHIEKIILNSVISFFFLFIISKFMGKKQIAQLDFIDYVIGISLGSIAAELATSIDKPFYYYLIAMTLFTLLEVAVSLIGRKSKFLKKLVVGAPVVLVEDGILQYKSIKKTRLTVDEFVSLCREQGYFDINNIAYCLFETSGKISILPKSFAKPIIAKDLDIKNSRSGLVPHVVLDGKIIEESLQLLGKNREWLFSKINIQTDEEAENIALAIYDEEQDTVHVHPKE